MTNLAPLGGSQSTANAINNAGWCCGPSVYRGDASADAFSYSGGVMTDLGYWFDSTATGINASGQIVGDNSSNGFLDSGGVVTSLPTLGGFSAELATSTTPGRSWAKAYRGRRHH